MEINLQYAPISEVLRRILALNAQTVDLEAYDEAFLYFGFMGGLLSREKTQIVSHLYDEDSEGPPEFLEDRIPESLVTGRLDLSEPAILSEREGEGIEIVIVQGDTRSSRWVQKMGKHIVFHYERFQARIEGQLHEVLITSWECEGGGPVDYFIWRSL